MFMVVGEHVTNSERLICVFNQEQLSSVAQTNKLPGFGCAVSWINSSWFFGIFMGFVRGKIQNINRLILLD